MSDFATKQFIEQAQQSLGSGKIAEALEFAQQAAALDPANAEALMLCAVAFSQLNRPLEADDAFAKSAELTPTNPKLYYNWAVHHYSMGNKQEALAKGRNALDLDPSHASARDLVIRLEGELGLRSAAPTYDAPPVPGPFPQGSVQPPTHYYANYEPPLHSLKFVEKLGPTWDLLGWGFGGLRMLMFLISLAQMSKVLSDASSDTSQVMTNIANNPLYYQSGSNPVISGVAILLMLAVLVWLILDILDRRASWLWLIPYVVFCCCTCSAFDWIILPLYVFVGRPKLKS